MYVTGHWRSLASRHCHGNRPNTGLSGGLLLFGKNLSPVTERNSSASFKIEVVALTEVRSVTSPEGAVVWQNRSTQKCVGALLFFYRRNVYRPLRKSSP
jgi:hypothetical protein